MRRTLMLIVIASLVAAHPMWARTEAIPPTLWSVEEGDSTADVERIILRADSPVRAEIGIEMSQVRVDAEWLARVEMPRPTVTLRLGYDDGVSESLRQVFAREGGRHELVFEPQWSAGRIVQTLELSHDRDGAEVEVHAVTVESTENAVTMASSWYGQAELHTEEELPNDLLILDWMTISWHRPYLAGVNAHRIGVVASTIATGDFHLEQEEELVLEALDEAGAVLKRLTLPVDGEVKRLEFVLEGVDLDAVEQVAFEAEDFADITIRQIVVGGWTPGGPPRALQQLNDHFGRILYRYRRDGEVSAEVLSELQGLLRRYRALE